jgi:hypothetical protein
MFRSRPVLEYNYHNKHIPVSTKWNEHSFVGGNNSRDLFLI